MPQSWTRQAVGEKDTQAIDADSVATTNDLENFESMRRGGTGGGGGSGSGGSSTAVVKSETITAAGKHKEEVQTKLDTSDPKPQMVLTNVITRDLEAIELLRETHEQHPNVALALITNGGRNLSATEAASCGVFAFLREPLRLSELELYLTRL